MEVDMDFNPFENYALSVVSDLPRPENFQEPSNLNKDGAPDLWDIWKRVEGEIVILRRLEELRDINDEGYENEPPVEIETTDKTQVDVLSMDEVLIQIEDSRLKDEEQNIIDEGSSIYSIDIFAFYKTIHRIKEQPFQGKWGIFIFSHGIKSMAENLEVYYAGRWSSRECLKKAIKLLHRHERYHWYIDAWTIQHEALEKKPLYENYLNFYYKYLYPRGTVEEALANKHAYTSMRREGITDFMRDFMDNSPGMYSRYHEDPMEKRGQLAAHILDGNAGILIPYRRKDQEHWIGNAPPSILRDEYCPIYIIMKSNITNILPPGIGAPGFKEHEGFIKRYLDGKPLSMTDHEYYKIDNGEHVKIPNVHGDTDRLKPWEFKGTLLKAGMQQAEYREERMRTHIWKKHVPRPVAKPPIKN